MKRKLILSILITTIAAVVRGQGSEPYSLKKVLEMAVQANSNVVQAKYDYEEGAAKTREVMSSALPQININAELNDNVLQQAIVFPKAFADPTAGSDEFMVLRAGMQYGLSTNASASQQIFNKSLLTGIKAAKTSEEFYLSNIERTEEDVILQTSNLFYQAASLRAQRQIIDSNLEQVKKNLKITTAQVENGVARKVDADRLRVTVSNLQTQLRTIDDNYNNVINKLKLSMGLDVNTPIEITVPLLTDSSKYELNSAIVQSEWKFENKVEYRQLTTQIELYDLERKNFAAGYYPTLSAYGNYTYNGQSNDFILSSNSNPLWFDVASVGLRLNIPVFDGGSKSARMQQSKIHKMAAQQDLAFMKQQSNMEYLIAAKSLETSFESYNAQRENVALANSVYDVTLQNYQEGVSPLTDLLQAEASRIQAQSQLIESLLKVKQAEIALLKATGEIKTLLN